MTVRGRGRNLRRQALGVAGLSVVASGTTALVLVLGSSQLSTTWLSSEPFFGSTSTGNPLIVASPAPRVVTNPVPTATVAFTSATNLTTVPRPRSAPSAVPTVTRTPPPPPPPAPKPPPRTFGGHDCAVLTDVLGHWPTPKQKSTIRAWAARQGHPVSTVCAVVTIKGFAQKFGTPHSGHKGHGPHPVKPSQGVGGGHTPRPCHALLGATAAMTEHHHDHGKRHHSG